MRKKRNIFLLLFLSLVLIVSACSSGSSGGSEQSTAGNNQASSNQDTENRVLTVAMGTDMLGWDPHNHQNTGTEAIHVNFYSYVVKNEMNEIKPDLAIEWELIADDTWEFKMREDATFHNGDPVTAHDVKFSLERVAHDATLREHPNYKTIVRVDVVDDYTFRIVTDGPDPVLLNRISRLGSGILPSKYIEEHGWEYFESNPIGSGPFKYVEWIKDDRVVLEPYENYFGGKVTEWDKIVFRAIPENSTRVAELLTGGVDIAVNVSPADWDRINANEGTSVKSGIGNRTMLLFLRTTEGYPTADIRVRQAIDYAIDDKAIVDHLLKGGGTPTLTRVNPGNFGHHPELFGKYNYDPEKAKQLLAEAGYPDGLDITIHSGHGRYLMDKETVEMIGGMLAQVGIRAKLDFMEWGAFVDLRQAKKHEDAYFIGLGASLYDAAQSLEYYHSSTASSINDYYNEEVDRLLDAARVNLDPVEREKQYQRVQEIVAEELPIIPLFQVDNFYGVSDRIDFEPRMDEMIRADLIKRK